MRPAGCSACRSTDRRSERSATGGSDDGLVLGSENELLERQGAPGIQCPRNRSSGRPRADGRDVSGSPTGGRSLRCARSRRWRCWSCSFTDSSRATPVAVPGVNERLAPLTARARGGSTERRAAGTCSERGTRRIGDRHARSIRRPRPPPRRPAGSLPRRLLSGAAVAGRAVRLRRRRQPPRLRRRRPASAPAAVPAPRPQLRTRTRTDDLAAPAGYDATALHDRVARDVHHRRRWPAPMNTHAGNVTACKPKRHETR